MNTARAAMMPRRRTQLSLGVLMLFVVVAAILLADLKVLVDHRDDIRLIWENVTGRHTYAPTPLRWSDTPGPPAEPRGMTDGNP